MPKPESTPFMQPQSSGSVGWNLSAPTAPVNEKY